MTTSTCPDCLTGSIKAGDPNSIVTTLHGLETYVARPPGTPKGVIVIIPDFCGWEISNSRLLADSYAKKGASSSIYQTSWQVGGFEISPIFPQILTAFQLLAAAIPSLLRNKDGVVKLRIWNFCSGVRKDLETGSLKLGVAGFFWGAHPRKMKFPDEWEAVKKPLSVGIGDVDMAIKIAMVKDIKDLLQKKEDFPCELMIYPGARHEFAVRADPTDEGQTQSEAEAETQAPARFTKCFASGGN